MSEGFTHRSHHHTLCCLPKPYVDVLQIDQNAVTSQKLKNLFQEYWPYGMIRWSKPVDGGMFVKSEFAGRYTSKYVVKDINFLVSLNLMNIYLSRNLLKLKEGLKSQVFLSQALAK